MPRISRKRTIALNQNPPIKPMFTIPRMGRMVPRAWFKDVLDAFSNNDLAKARAGLGTATSRAR